MKSIIVALVLLVSLNNAAYAYALDGHNLTCNDGTQYSLSYANCPSLVACAAALCKDHGGVALLLLFGDDLSSSAINSTACSSTSSSATTITSPAK